MSYRSLLRQYMEIVKFVEKAHYPRKNDILDHLNDVGIATSERSFDRHLQGLREEFSINIAYCRQHRGYHIEPSDEGDMARFLMLVDAMTHADVMLEILKDAKDTLPYIDFENKDMMHGIEHLKDILFAIKNNYYLNFKHYSYQRKSQKEYTVEPYFLKQYQGRWYVIAYVDYVKDYRTFGVDRIVDIEVLHKSFKPRKNNVRERFSDVVGLVYSDLQPVRVKLFMDKVQGQYLKNLPLHPSQICEETTDGMEISLYVVLNYELEQRILSYGSTLQVLEPESLQQKILSHARAMTKLYE